MLFLSVQTCPTGVKLGLDYICLFEKFSHRYVPFQGFSGLTTCFLSRRAFWLHPPSNIISVTAGKSGWTPGGLLFTQLFYRLMRPASILLTDVGSVHLLIRHDSLCGFPLKTFEVKQLAPLFPRPFGIEKVINLSAVKLPNTMKIHPTFHVF